MERGLMGLIQLIPRHIYTWALVDRVRSKHMDPDLDTKLQSKFV